MVGILAPRWAYERAPNPMSRGTKWALGLGAVAMTLGGVYLIARNASAAPAAPSQPQEPSPWHAVDIDVLSDLAEVGLSLDDIQIVAEGSGTTHAGLPYMYRVYEILSDVAKGEEAFSAVVLYQLPDGSWRSWLSESDTEPQFHWVPQATAQGAVDFVHEWASGNIDPQPQP